jgi:WD40 repeat protein
VATTQSRPSLSAMTTDPKHDVRKEYSLMRYWIAWLFALAAVFGASRAQTIQRSPAEPGRTSSSALRPQLVPQLGHVTDVDSVQFSQDGRQVLTSDIYETVLWDVVTGREVRRFLGSGGTFSPNGTWVLTGGRENTARVWDVATGREVHRFSGGGGTFSPDGTLAGRRFVDSAKGTLTLRFTGYTETISSVALSPDGKQVLTSSSDNTVRVWDVATGREVRRFYGGDGVFSPDGKQVITGSYDNTVGSSDVPASHADKTVRLWLHRPFPQGTFSGVLPGW